MKFKQSTSLIVALAVPLLMIVLVVISIYVPGLFAPAPRFNFIYVTGDDYYQGNQYVVENGRLAKHEIKTPEHYTPGVTRFFMHNVSSNTSKEISFEDAQQLHLDANITAPDGYEVVYGNAEYGFFPLFFSGGQDYNSMYLKGHYSSKKLNLQIPADRSYSYRDHARFIGWIR